MRVRAREREKDREREREGESESERERRLKLNRSKRYAPSIFRLEPSDLSTLILNIIKEALW